MTEQNGVPQFDFSDLSWGDDKLASEISIKTRKAQMENDVEGIREALFALEQYMAKVTVYVPREWLVKSAPADIDWSDPSSMNYLRAPSMNMLREAMEKAKTGN